MARVVQVGVNEPLGSSALLTNEWVLTAKHLFGEGTNRSKVRFVMGDQVREPRLGEWFEHPTRDVALIRLRQPFAIGGSTSSFSRSFVEGLTAEDILAAHTGAECFGFGPTSTGGSGGQLHAATFALRGDTISETPDPHLLETLNESSGFTAQDEGGPCLSVGSSQLLGVHVRPNPPESVVTFGVAEAITGFRSWLNDILGAAAAASADFDSDGVPDLATFTNDGGTWVFRVDFSNLGTTVLDLSNYGITIPASPTNVHLLAGNFNGDISGSLKPVGDLFIYIDGQVAALRGGSGGFVPQDPITPLADDYVSFDVVDVYSNFFDDVIARRPNGEQHIYPGGSGGLGSSRAPFVVATLRGPDFDGDGLEDVATGAPGERKSDLPGTVYVLFGNGQRRVIDASIGGATQPTDRFGLALEWGSFDGDELFERAVDELVVGDPDATVDGVEHAGKVHYLRFSGGNFVDRVIDITDFGQPASDVRFGSSLAVGDFNGDRIDDLAVGARSANDRGEVHILYGVAGDGISASSPHVVFTADDMLVAGNSHPNLGHAMVAGDFNCDGFEDLAAAAPQANIPGEHPPDPDFSQPSPVWVGQVTVVYGGPSGLDISTAQPWRIDLLDLGGNIFGRSGDRLGMAVAAGNFNGDVSGTGDHCSDLLAFADTGAGYGAVYLIYGGINGLRATDTKLYHRGVNGFPGPEVAWESFGLALSPSRVNADAIDDLLLAVPGKHVGGSVYILPGSPTGLLESELTEWTQDTPGIPEIAEGLGPEGHLAWNDHFGGAVGGTSNGLVAISAKWEDLAVKRAGTLTIVSPARSAAVEVAEAVVYDAESFGGTAHEAANLGHSITRPHAGTGTFLREASAPYVITAAHRANACSTCAEVAQLAGGFGFEDPSSPWTSPSGALSLDTTRMTEGQASLKIGSTGYIEITSAPFNTRVHPEVGTELSVDVFVPGPSSTYAGDIQAAISIPAAGLFNGALGTVGLNSLPRDTWSTIHFPVPTAVQTALLGDYPRARVQLTVNAGVADILLDYMRFSGTLTPRTPPPPDDVFDSSPLMGFDVVSDWSSAQAVLELEEQHVMQGAGALAIHANGWTEITSRQFDTVEVPPATSTLSVSLWVPDPQPNPDWVGALQAYFTCPSGGAFSVYLGQAELTSLFYEEFNAITYTLPSSVVSILNSSHNDCSFTFALNVNPQAGTFILDNMGFR